MKYLVKYKIHKGIEDLEESIIYLEEYCNINYVCKIIEMKSIKKMSNFDKIEETDEFCYDRYRHIIKYIPQSIKILEERDEKNMKTLKNKYNDKIEFKNTLMIEYYKNNQEIDNEYKDKIRQSTEDVTNAKNELIANKNELIDWYFGEGESDYIEIDFNEF